MHKIDAGTWARTVVLIFALLNQTLTMFNLNPLPFSDEQIYEFVTILFTVGATLAAWWKNNSFTDEAIKADKFMKRIKEEE